jgi:hypothetical protein
MPRTPLDYSQTIIYKIVCNDVNVKHCYVGHTTNFTNRKHTHKINCNYETSSHYNLKKYQLIRQYGGFDNWSMIEIEKYPCNDLQEAIARERYYYDLLGADMNSQVPARSDAEYNKYYAQKNFERIKQKTRERNSVQHQCECGGTYIPQHRLRHFETKRHKHYVTINKIA